MSVPWTSGQLGRVVGGNALGAALVLVGWFRSATADEVVRTRLSGLAIAVAGLLVAGVANGLWLASLRARVRLGRDVAGAEVARLLPAHGAVGPASDADVVVSAPGMSRYHRPACELAAGKPTRPLSRRQRASTRLRACEVCLGGGTTP